MTSVSSFRCPPEVKVFLEDILDHPEDDTPRLILADLLQDHAHPWGELLRAQTWRIRRAEGDPDYLKLREREREWLANYSEQILEPFRDLGWRGRFHRGMIHILAHVAMLFDSRVEELARSEVWSWVEMIRIVGHGPMNPLDLVLPECSQLQHFPGLDLVSAGLGDEGIARLSLSEYLSGLKRLDLGFNQIGADGADALAACPALSGLRTLGLDDNYLGHAGVEALVGEDSQLVRLHTLDLRWNGLGVFGARALANSALTELTTLYLGNNNLGDEGAKALAETKGLANLTTLYVEHNRIDEYWLNSLRERFGPKVFG